MKAPGTKRIVTTAILIVLYVHLFFAIGLVFVPGHINPGSSRLARVYKYLVHLGPFYREDAIQTSPHLIVVVNGTKRNLIATHQQNYQNKPWKINELTLRDNVRRGGDLFYSSGTKPSSKGFRKLFRATQSDMSPSVNDSVSWTYFHRRYIRADNTWRNDTLFNYHFKWSEDD